MRACVFAYAVCVTLVTSWAYAHGPQIQITNDSDQIVTRELILEQPYSTGLTTARSVYVIPLREFNGVWYSRPNDTPHPILPDLPAYFSGPGFAYGYDLADGGPQEFEADSVLSLAFTAGLMRWNGAAFEDAGATELKAFSGSNIDTTTNFAITSDGGPFDSITVATVTEDYGPAGADVHSTIRYGLLGDGSSPTSSSPNGVYLVSLQLSSTQDSLVPSDEFRFLLYRHTSLGTVAEAVAALGVDPSQVQWIVPEPGLLGLLSTGVIRLLLARRGVKSTRNNQR